MSTPSHRRTTSLSLPPQLAECQTVLQPINAAAAKDEKPFTKLKYTIFGKDEPDWSGWVVGGLWTSGCVTIRMRMGLRWVTRPGRLYSRRLSGSMPWRSTKSIPRPSPMSTPRLPPVTFAVRSSKVSTTSPSALSQSSTHSSLSSTVLTSKKIGICRMRVWHRVGAGVCVSVHRSGWDAGWGVYASSVVGYGPVSDEHGCGTFKLTMRQTFQFRGVIKKHPRPTIQDINRAPLNIMAGVEYYDGL